jgi:hypothetical protein
MKDPRYVYPGALTEVGSFVGTVYDQQWKAVPNNLWRTRAIRVVRALISARLYRAHPFGITCHPPALTRQRPTPASVTHFVYHAQHSGEL